MPATDSSVTRETDDAGDAIATSTKNDGARVQNFTLDPEVMGEALATPYISSAVENVVSVKATPGRAFHVDVSLPGVAADRWLMLINKASNPIATDPAVRQKLLPGGTVYAKIDFPEGGYGQLLSAGVAVAISTTPTLLTLPAGPEAHFTADYL